MDTPVKDFVEKYAQSHTSRFHMPGHKGKTSALGVEPFDITEIKGADYLYDASGIIGQSEKNCSKLFGTAETLYSTEGSSLSVRTMVTLAVQNRKDHSSPGQIIVPRNCHASFVSGCILAGAVPVWIYPENAGSVCSCPVTAEDIAKAADKAENPCGVYITSPDYLGNIADIRAISKVCKERGLPLLVDNAHGAYFKFLDEDIHPITLGADMCCDSAHKTLPVLTGGGYLHISKNAPEFFRENAKRVMSLYASTSPSFLILQSLDICNRILAEGFRKRLAETADSLKELCEFIKRKGFDARTDEPLKLTVYPNAAGYLGTELGDILRSSDAEPEYADLYSLVLIASPDNGEKDYERVRQAFSRLELKQPICTEKEVYIPPKAVLAPREAAFAPFETVSVENSEGRICAACSVSCQPSVPVLVSGEEINGSIIKILKRYSIFQVNVLK